jgi:hypothetical protein
MSAASSKSKRTTSKAISNATSSPASEAGVTPSGSPEFLTTDLFGQVLVPASPSAPPVKARRAMTNVTFGLRGYLSSPSAALQSSLESKLRRRLDGAGSILFSTTWRRKATPAHRPYYQLVASVRHTSEIEFGSWPTPMAGTPAQKGYNEAGNNDSSRKTVALAAWPTPNHNSTGAGHEGREGGLNLQTAVQLAAWPTPDTGIGPHGHRGVSTKDHHQSAKDLQATARLAAWPTTTVEDARSSRRHGYMKTGNQGTTLTDAASLAGPGPTLNGSDAPTASSGQLNPAHSRWLMGLPSAWDLAAPSKASRERKC